MQVLLFTVISCISCDAHRKKVQELCLRHKIKMRLFNIDDPQHLSINMSAMRKWNIQKTPSIVTLDVNGNLINTIQGVNRSIEKLETIINENNK